MTNPWRHIDVEIRGPLRCVRLRQPRLEEGQIDALANDLVALGAEDGCSRVVLSLGPKPPECLYSVFLGKLISVQRRLREKDRQLILCDARPEVMAIFAACKLVEHFTFVADFDAAASL
jgi:hypothetical protein